MWLRLDHRCPWPQYLDDPLLVPLEDDDYIAFGLACCFVMNDNLKLDGEIGSCLACVCSDRAAENRCSPRSNWGVSTGGCRLEA